MKTIYLDHNVAHYFVRGFNPASIAADERRALEECFERAPNIRFTLSFWNMLAAARERGHGSGAQLFPISMPISGKKLRPLHLP
jgi:hypothetical protein